MVSSIILASASASHARGSLPPGAAAVRHLIETARPNSTLSYDPNVRPSLMGELGAAREAIEGMVALADIVKASEEDLAWLYPDGSVHAEEIPYPKGTLVPGSDAILVMTPIAK